jgi:hypothetical protein
VYHGSYLSSFPATVHFAVCVLIAAYCSNVQLNAPFTLALNISEAAYTSAHISLMYGRPLIIAGQTVECTRQRRQVLKRVNATYLGHGLQTRMKCSEFDPTLDLLGLLCSADT